MTKKKNQYFFPPFFWYLESISLLSSMIIPRMRVDDLSKVPLKMAIGLFNLVPVSFPNTDHILPFQNSFPVLEMGQHCHPQVCISLNYVSVWMGRYRVQFALYVDGHTSGAYRNNQIMMISGKGGDDLLYLYGKGKSLRRCRKILRSKSIPLLVTERFAFYNHKDFFPVWKFLGGDLPDQMRQEHLG